MKHTLYILLAAAWTLFSLSAHAQQVEPVEQQIQPSTQQVEPDEQQVAFVEQEEVVPEQEEVVPEQVELSQAEKFVQRLAEPDSLSGARSNVTIHFSAEESISKYNAQTSPKESYQGYRIRIFASKSQSARTDAEAAIALFEEHFKVPVYFAYENPYFLVTCGNCLSHEEAIILLSRVRKHFPKAFLVMSDIPAEALLVKPQPLSAPAEEVAAEEGTTESSTESTAESTAEASQEPIEVKGEIVVNEVAESAAPTESTMPEEGSAPAEV